MLLKYEYSNSWNNYKASLSFYYLAISKSCILSCKAIVLSCSICGNCRNLYGTMLSIDVTMPVWNINNIQLQAFPWYIYLLYKCQATPTNLEIWGKRTKMDILIQLPLRRTRPSWENNIKVDNEMMVLRNKTTASSDEISYTPSGRNFKWKTWDVKILMMYNKYEKY